MVVRKYKFLFLSVLCLIGLRYFVDTINSKTQITVKPQLIIYSYSSFASKWGPGPIIKRKFEEKCHCKVEMRSADDARMLIQRLALEGERTEADVIIGVNQWDLFEAEEKLKFTRSYELQEMQQLNDTNFQTKLGEPGELVPFDWGIFAFNTKGDSKIANAKNLNEFLNLLPEKSLVLQDPRTSAPGLSLLNWLVQVLGEEKAFQYFEKLNPKVYTITSGWSSSYGLFQKGQAQAVFSYVTSPLYHLVEENDKNYKALSFQEGLPIHVELAGVMKSCKNCALAKDYVQFLLTPEIQRILMKKNYMLPIDKSIVAKTPWDIEAKFKILPLQKITKDAQTRVIERWTQWSRKR